MTRITGTINIDFETENEVSQESWDLFKRKMENNIIDNFNEIVDGLADHCGIGSQETHSALLNDLGCDKENVE